ncbi:MAG: hypothetical protein JXN60_07470 [Lentisphaerae bacterium]|nr:hypothetical protein [Lentisphaerota bacterium]
MQLEWAGNNSQRCELAIELSWNAETNATDTGYQDWRETTTDTDSIFGGATDKWGRSEWRPADFSNANFRVRLLAVDATPLIHVDWIRVKVYYSLHSIYADNDGGASNVTDNSAVLNGRAISTNDTPPEAFIYWGASDGGTNKQEWDNEIAMGFQSGFFCTNVTGIAGYETNYYRCYATNNLGHDWADSTASFTMNDTDSDYMPDWWENLYDLNINYPNDATNDFDNDGINNFHEYICGTTPTNKESRLEIVSLNPKGNAHLDFEIRLGSGRIFRILAADNAYDTKTPVANIPNQSFEGIKKWIDTNAIIETDQRYYCLGVVYRGFHYTNIEEWAMYVQPREPSVKYMVSVPVDLGTNNNLNSTLGKQIAHGLSAGFNTNDSDCIYYRTTNNQWAFFHWVTNALGETNWWDFEADTKADLEITAGMGLWIVKGPSTNRPMQNCVFTGRSFVNAPAILFRTNNVTPDGWTWTAFGWPFAKSKCHCNYGTGATPSNQLGFAEIGYGGLTYDYTRPHADRGDQIWVWENNTFKNVYWLIGRKTDATAQDYNGRWWNNRTGTFAEFSLDPGKAYFYRHHVNTNGIPSGTNFWWQPVSP